MFLTSELTPPGSETSVGLSGSTAFIPRLARSFAAAASRNLAGSLNSSARIELSFRNPTVQVLSSSAVATSQHVANPEPERMDFLPSKDRCDVSASAQNLLRDYAGHRWPSLNHKGRMSRLAGLLGLGHRRVRAIYQADPSVRLRADELQRIEALQRREEEANRNEFQNLQARIARLEASLLTQDPDFHHDQVAAIRGSIAGGRRSYVAVAADDEPEDFSD